MDDLDFWYYVIGVNIIPTDTKNKKPQIPSWKEFQNRELTKEEYHQNKRAGKYSNGR
jgi:hypothetical protein